MSAVTGQPIWCHRGMVRSLHHIAHGTLGIAHALAAVGTAPT